MQLRKAGVEFTNGAWGEVGENRSVLPEADGEGSLASASLSSESAPWRDFRLRTDDYELLAEAWKAQMTRRASWGIA